MHKKGVKSPEIMDLSTGNEKNRPTSMLSWKRIAGNSI
jgi:hypothetical protein